MSDDGHHHDHRHDDGDAVCPVCEMKVNSAMSPTREYEGKTYYFCNESCMRAFDKEPAEYAVA